MGEASAATETKTAMRRHRLRVRTVAVSFAAAVRSARRETAAPGGATLIETWRTWAISTLDEYARDASMLMAAAGPEDDADRQALEDELERGYRMVREA